MARLEMDLEKLEAKTQARVDYVLECYDQDKPVLWDVAEVRAHLAAVDLDRYRINEALREMGRSARRFVDAILAIGEAFSEGYSEND